ncbi:hypothetical protein [Reyranella sp. CPCC 100927]|uniref:hypothetical protein n=1 Tax=Reyranella sp. CPCC 100927 TaxID=2599616 RepID=UPI0011B81DB4|nr:hypothetical protein [Reyranella sp. CPCC 100927]TWS96600.1 hypothetical protein FQU96_38905 [Reyranella sp. CPCC 100927]
MSRYWTAMVMLAGLLLGNVEARADVVERNAVGIWSLEAHKKDGAFDYCTVTSQYGGGAEVHFMLTRKLQWSILIKNPKWNWRPESEGTATYWIDSQERRNGRAMALRADVLMVVLADSQELLGEIREGNVMYFEPQGANNFSITLKGTSDALGALMSCLRRHYR